MYVYIYIVCTHIIYKEDDTDETEQTKDKIDYYTDVNLFERR